MKRLKSIVCLLLLSLIDNFALNGMNSNELDIARAEFSTNLFQFINDVKHAPETIVAKNKLLEQAAQTFDQQIFGSDTTHPYLSIDQKTLNSFLNDTLDKLIGFFEQWGKWDGFSITQKEVLDWVLIKSKLSGHQLSTLYTIVNDLTNIINKIQLDSTRIGSLDKETFNKKDKLLSLYSSSLRTLAFLHLIDQLLTTQSGEIDVNTIYKDLSAQAPGMFTNFTREDLNNFYTSIKQPLETLLATNKNFITDFNNYFTYRINSNDWQNDKLYRFLVNVPEDNLFEDDYFDDIESTQKGKKLIDLTAAEYALPLTLTIHSPEFEHYAALINFPKTQEGLKLLKSLEVTPAILQLVLKTAIYKTIELNISNKTNKNFNFRLLDNLEATIKGLLNIDNQAKDSYFTQIAMAKQLIPRLLQYFSAQQTSAPSKNPLFPTQGSNLSPVQDVELITYIKRTQDSLKNIYNSINAIQASDQAGAERLKKYILHDVLSLNNLLTQDAVLDNKNLMLPDSPIAPQSLDIAKKYLNAAQDLNTIINNRREVDTLLIEQINRLLPNKPLLLRWIGGEHNYLSNILDDYIKNPPLSAEQLSAKIKDLDQSLHSLRTIVRGTA